MADDVDMVMESVPAKWRYRWCGAEKGPCGCMGCVQIGNRLIMVGRKVNQGDPERIDETRIPLETYVRFKVTKSEWEAWKGRQEGLEK